MMLKLILFAIMMVWTVFAFGDSDGELTKVRRIEVAEIPPSTVTQGKPYKNNEERCAAAHAVDKDLSTVAATETDNGAGWLKLEFDRTYLIHRVLIYYRFYTNWYDPDNWCALSEANFRKCVDAENNVDVSVYQGEVKQKSCGTLQLTYGLEQADQIYTLICNTEGDTVKLSKSTGHIAVFEVAIISTVLKLKLAEVTPTTVTHGKTYLNNEKSYAAAYAVDKDLSTVAATETDNGAGWLKLEFDRTYFIHKVLIYYRFYTNWYNPDYSCVQNEATFKYCINTVTNVDVSVYQGEEQLKSCGTLQLTYGLEQADQIYTLICNTEGNTLKLSKSTGLIAVSEVATISTVLKQKLAEITPPKVTNGKTLDNNEESYAAAHAVDKDLSTVAATYTDKGAGWLKLEFDRTYLIHKVLIYYKFYTNWYNPDDWCVQSANFKTCLDYHNNVDVSGVPGRSKTEVLWNTPTNIRTRAGRPDLHTDL
ncbi:uncharacterized protein LOC134821947 [Bolinopsis microptera]|uniref:uncharacterized protein LOC134821947 n=1 Tax=Bolinopsis microptera TaxID=2820187 RepID=UPI00307A660D